MAKGQMREGQAQAAVCIQAVADAGFVRQPLQQSPGKEVLIITGGQQFLLSNLVVVPGFVLQVPGR
jgi:hypothetical protein